MASNITPILSELFKDIGVCAVGVRQACGNGLDLPVQIQTSADKAGPAVYREMKINMLTVLVLAWMDKTYPTFAEQFGHGNKGDVSGRIAMEMYRMLTDGVSIDALRVLVGDPDPHAKVLKS